MLEQWKLWKVEPPIRQWGSPKQRSAPPKKPILGVGEELFVIIVETSPELRAEITQLCQLLERLGLRDGGHGVGSVPHDQR